MNEEQYTTLEFNKKLLKCKIKVEWKWCSSEQKWRLIHDDDESATYTEFYPEIF